MPSLRRSPVTPKEFSKIANGIQEIQISPKNASDLFSLLGPNGARDFTSTERRKILADIRRVLRTLLLLEPLFDSRNKPVNLRHELQTIQHATSKLIQTLGNSSLQAESALSASGFYESIFESSFINSDTGQETKGRGGVSHGIQTPSPAKIEVYTVIARLLRSCEVAQKSLSGATSRSRPTRSQAKDATHQLEQIFDNHHRWTISSSHAFDRSTKSKDLRHLHANRRKLIHTAFKLINQRPPTS